MGISISFFLFDTAGFSGTQGNDIPGFLRVVDYQGNPHDISGAINWQIKQGNNTIYIGLVPDANLTVTIPILGGGTYTVNNTKSLAIQNVGITTVYADGSNVNGSANPPDLADIPQTVYPNDPNNPPTLNSTDDITVPDGTTLPVKTYNTQEWVTWHTSGGTDETLFYMDPRTGELSFVSPPSYANPSDSNQDNIYTVQISAMDVDANISIQMITVRVQPNVNITSTKTVEPVSLPQNAFICATQPPETSAEYYLPGTCVAYTVTVVNEIGSPNLQSLTVTDDIPSNLTPVSVYSNTGFDSVNLSVVGMTVSATVTNLNPGNSASFVLRALIKK
jgi:hypothetical protein